jgi:hypothetical protein
MKPTAFLLALAAGLAITNAQDRPDGPPPERRDAPPEKRDGPGPEAMRERMEQEQRAFRTKMQQKMEQAMKEAAELEAAGKKDEAEAARRAARERADNAVREFQAAMQKKNQEAMRGRGDRRPEGPPPDMEGRLKHIREAVAHLHEAGLHDIAENVARMAERMRQGDRPDGPPPERGDARRPGPELEGLRREIQELREAVRGLKAEKKD